MATASVVVVPAVSARTLALLLAEDRIEVE
jgi:hypothetical protein